jgi:outer membrane protein TolC
LLGLAAACHCGCQTFERNDGAAVVPAPSPRQAPDPAPDTSQPEPDIPAPVASYTLDLETALELAGAENPTIARAREAVRAGEAEQLQARALLLPTLHAGMDVNLHEGKLQAATSLIRDLHRESLYGGAGAAAVGAGTVNVPGVRLFAHLGDAVLAPRAARYQVAGRQLDSAAVRNAILLDVATRYLDLIGAEERVRALRESEREFGEVARLTANFAEAGQGREGDAQRARGDALLLHVEVERAEEEVGVASAELARLLGTDPAVRLEGPGAPVPLLQLVDPAIDLESLVQTALRNRPELGARAADVARNRTRLRQEQVRPLLPVLSVGFSAGDFGGGSNLVTPRFGNFNGRTDFDAFAVWSLEGLGLGNLALQRERRAQVNESLAERGLAIDLVRREVADAHARSAERWRRVEVARRQLRTAEEGFRLDLERSKHLVDKLSRPIEVLNSSTLLSAARQEYLRALVGYDQAQFQLFVALGQPPTEAALTATPCP